MTDYCNQFSRATALRRLLASTARPGSGLPTIEPGMPLPAGTGLSRRTFLTRSTGAALSVFCAKALLPHQVDTGISEAMASNGPNTVLVSIHVPGGLDSLELLAPASDPIYQKLRPNLRLAYDPKMTVAGDDRLQWHPQAQPLKALHEAGKLTILPAIGYPAHNQSHFTSNHFYEVGALDEHAITGWMGRWLDRNNPTANPLQGVTLHTTLAPALAPATSPVSVISSPTNFKLWAANVDQPTLTKINDTYSKLAHLPTDDPALNAARAAGASVATIQDSLAPIYNKPISDTPAAASYPVADEFSDRLRGLAKMLHMGLPIRCVSLYASGNYDTHQDQKATLSKNFGVLASALAAFQADIEQRFEGPGQTNPLSRRVLVHVWSEFGRRPAENAGGTDHGSAGMGLLMSAADNLAKGMEGEFPGLQKLDVHDNLLYSTDYRAVYRTLLENWLGGDLSGVLPDMGSVPNLSLIQS